MHAGLSSFLTRLMERSSFERRRTFPIRRTRSMDRVCSGCRTEPRVSLHSSSLLAVVLGVRSDRWGGKEARRRKQERQLTQQASPAPPTPCPYVKKERQIGRPRERSLHACRDRARGSPVEKKGEQRARGFFSWPADQEESALCLPRKKAYLLCVFSRSWL